MDLGLIYVSLQTDGSKKFQKMFLGKSLKRFFDILDNEWMSLFERFAAQSGFAFSVEHVIRVLLSA